MTKVSTRSKMDWSDRLLSTSYSHDSYHGNAEEELGEEEVWSWAFHEPESTSTAREDGDAVDVGAKMRRSASSALPTVAKQWLPSRREGQQKGGLSLAFEDKHTNPAAAARIIQQFRGMTMEKSEQQHGAVQSAPMNVPDWSRVMGDAEDEGEEEGEWLPPHEYLARSRDNTVTATSVFEGVGRTLKGRDMSRVRNAVWRRTGFFG
ncbi:hypothetical protein AMTRI_Chr02g216050 [Amborella trichopoda]|uniref:Senescence regulator n=1 Tax=Amborella trichopoda TaxID=13333 RepID=U5DAA3_AMBTC|nr:uncharacterized protein LOC18445659 [Amborella trichopoda]ERN17323.1 hypothetical protein AMTR_s00037p00097690 [Amborella trichopoda]|eukprot:XP_006855856.1 uncharacterized protein LOC18445659 [Amborella trichopoda]